MYNVTNTFLSNVKLPTRSIDVKATLGTDIELVSDDIISFSIDSAIGNSDVFAIGSVNTTKLTLKIVNNSKIPISLVSIPICPYVSINGEWVKLGTFYADMDSIKKTDQSINIECFDVITRSTEQEYATNITFPTDSITLAKDLQRYVTFKDITQISNRKVVAFKDKVTVRAVLSELALLSACNCMADRDGKIVFLKPSNTNFALDANNYIDFNLESDNNIKISKLVVEKDNGNIECGDNTGKTISFKSDNVTESTTLKAIYDLQFPYNYVPYSLKLQGMPHLDCGDIVTLTDIKNVVRNLCIVTSKLEFNGGLISEFSCKAPGSSTSQSAVGGSMIAQLNKARVDIIEVQEALIGKASIDDLKANNAVIESLKSKDAEIDKALIGKANISDLTASNITFGTASGGTLSLQSLLSQFISGANAQIINLTSANATFANGVIGSAQISSLDVAKLNAGVLDTTKISIAGANSRLTIKGNVLQIFDTDVNNKLFERVAIGDINHDGSKYGIRIRGSNGTTTLFDENGQTKEGFTDGYNKLDDNSLSSNKIDINSVVTRINNEGTTTIAGTKILVGDRTLELAFSTLNTTVNNQGQTISNQSTQISANTTAIALKLDTQTFTSYKNNNDTNINNINTTLNKATTDISALQGQIVLKVSQEDINTSISKIKIGGRNLLKNSGWAKDTSYWNLATNVSMDTTVTFNGQNSMVSNQIGLTSQSWRGISSVYIQCNPGDVFTGSVFARTDNIASIDANAMMEIIFFDVNHVRLKTYATTMNLSQNNVWKSISNTTSAAPDNTSYVQFYCYVTQNGKVWFACPKLESGNKVTDWTPAPEDAQVQIDSATTRIYNAEGSIKDLKDSIVLKVSSDEFTTYKGTVSSSINNISVGVRNLYKASMGISVLSPSSGATVTKDYAAGYDTACTATRFYNTSTTTNGTFRISSVIPKNGIYSISLYVKSNNSNLYNCWLDICDTTIQNSNFTVTPTWQYIKLEGYNVNNYGNGNVYNFVDINIPANSDVLISHLMVIEGTKAPSWTPAPEDIQVQIDRATSRIHDAELKIRDDSIISTVTNSQIYKDNLTGKVDASIYSTTMKQLSDSISSKVEKNDFGSLITQNADSVQVAFGYVGNGQNLVRNGNATFGTNNWGAERGTGLEFSTGVISGKTCFIFTNSNAVEHYLYQNAIPVKPNTKYTISFLYYTDNANTMDCYVIGTTTPTLANTYIHRALGNGSNHSAWQKVVYTFTTNTDEKYLFLRFDNNGATGTAASYNVAFTEVKLEEGDKATPFCLTSDEMNNTSVVMDNTGLSVNNGALQVKRKDGTTVLSVDTNGINTIGTFLQYNSATKAKSVEIANNKLNFYDYQLDYGDSNCVGGMYSTIFSDMTDNHKRAGLFVGGTQLRNHSISLGWVNNDGSCQTAINIDPAESSLSDTTTYGNNYRQGVIGIRQDVAIWPLNPVTFMSNNFTAGNNGRVCTMYATLSNNLAISLRNAYTGLRISYGDVSYPQHVINSSYTDVANISGSAIDFYAPFNCHSSKNRVVDTSYGQVALGAYETPTPMFGDCLRGTIGEDGTVKIIIDPIMLECGNTTIDYDVFVSPYGEGVVYVNTKEMTPQYFIVHGTPGLEFAYEYKVKQKGFENDRFKRIPKNI